MLTGKFFCWATLCVLVIAPGRPLYAQASASGMLTGMVLDPDKRAIPGAKVTIRNLDFATQRILTTGGEGDFAAISLPAGNYFVQAEAAGFKPNKVGRVLVSVGSSVRLTLQLQVAGVSQSVTVKGHGGTVEGQTIPPATNKEEPSTGNFFAGLTVTYLPNRNRDFTQFTQLAGGSLSGTDTNPVIAGQRPDDSKTEIDGAGFDDPLLGGMRGSRDTAMFFPQTVVREFQVVQSGAGADVSGTNAGFVNIVTKEGGNKLRGEAFYIGRPATLSSGDAFGHSLDNMQHEFGLSAGGPIRKNKAFFYAGFEQDFLHVPYWTEFQPQAPGVAVPAQLAALQVQTVEKNNPTAMFGRTDFILNKNNTLMVAFNYNRLDASNVGIGSTRTDAAPSHSDALDGQSFWARGNLNTVVRNDLVNQFLLGWSRDERNLNPNSTGPEIFINGFGILGGDSLGFHHYTSDRLETSDDVAFSHGSSIIHVGVDFDYDPAQEVQEANPNGRFDFNSLDDYLALNPRRFQQTFAVGNVQYDAAVHHAGFYATGKFNLRRQLTLTAGLRWDGQWNPQPGQPNPAIPQTTGIPNDLKQWQPRLGLAWSPAPKTVVRFSTGLYDSPTPATYFHRVFADNGANAIVADSYFDPQVLPLAIAGGLHGFAAPPVLAQPAALAVGMDPDFRNPRSFQVSGNVEQQIGKATVSAGYLRNSTWGLLRQIDANLFPPVGEINGLPVFGPSRPDLNVGRLLLNQSSAHSSYDAFLLTGNFQLNRRTQVMANYTLASARDDDTTLSPFSRISALNPFNLALERADSNFDVRHTFNVSAIVNLPLGFKINPALIARSGLPYTPVVGYDLQNDGNDLNDRAIFNGSVAGRNSARQPGFANLDLRFVKDFTLRGEGHHLDLFLDVFNVTGADNRNFDADAISYYGAGGTPVFSAGQALFAPDTNHFGGARQIQFTARLVGF